ncbi:G protein-regulated inducer of neurite outgrowth 1 [Kryptolebias marmoratus]|uniref:G protein regulated inducer of neurite outgrowth 1 n=1 Tax=Kryptolebias marmoratus TaxID=37003 RepID=A0A3Q3AJH1_KRYMA|nr:G protein-regulated inducer of neurite outgrowth 1 [Kryptolebias marmoratus]
MGSLKDEKRGLGLGEDHQPSMKSDDRGQQAGSESSTSAEGHQRHMSQQSTSREEYQPNLHMSASSVEERNKTPISKDQGLSGVDGGTSDPSVSEGAKDCTQTDVMPLTSQSAAYETTATQKDATVSINPQSHEDAENMPDRGKVPVPPAPDPSDPRSPAPFGQQHMRTQVSLEVVQCHSAATSPMTPPEDGHSFFFPSTFGKCEGVAADTKDAELQVGQQVEFCSVATSPMTPKTPSTTAFPVLVGKGMAQKEMRKDKEQNKNEEREGFTATKGQVETESAGSSSGCLASGSVHPQGTCEDGSQQCKQQRMGSMDQDITILVTQHGNNEEEDEKMVESHFPSVEPEMVKIEEYEEEKHEDGKEAPEKSNSNQKQPEEPKDCSVAENSELTKNKATGEKGTDVSGTKPPESPAPFGCHNIRTQVSLEVVQCQSVATSPMTPPEGDQAFYFPSSFGKCGSVGTETKDAEMQVGQQVEFRSVATAPMTPRTPITTTFPDIKKEASIEERILEEKEEEEEDKRKQVMDGKEEECKQEDVTKDEDKTKVVNCQEKSEDSCEEPVQEVNWDEKGMTWEVYGAVVEVAVLGSAIQKHLEKQVLKQKQQTSVTPLEPSEVGQAGSDKGRARAKEEQDGKGSRRRRNPFRGLMENVQQPHCCTRAHTNE